MVIRRPSQHARHRARHRGGFALIDVIVGTILLAIGLSGILVLTSRALVLQRKGEVEVTAAALIDELLSTVLAEGPTDFRKMYDTFGRYDDPFGDYDYIVDIDDRGLGVPFRVTATVHHRPTDTEYTVQTLIADREGDEPNPPRQPTKPIDREERYDEMY